MKLTTWRHELTEALKANGETWQDVKASSLDDKWLDLEREPWSLLPGEPRLLLWTEKYIYFTDQQQPGWIRSIHRVYDPLKGVGFHAVKMYATPYEPPAA